MYIILVQIDGATCSTRRKDKACDLVTCTHFH